MNDLRVSTLLAFVGKGKRQAARKKPRKKKRKR
jgi:hypothetical protein